MIACELIGEILKRMARHLGPDEFRRLASDVLDLLEDYHAIGEAPAGVINAINLTRKALMIPDD